MALSRSSPMTSCKAVMRLDNAVVADRYSAFSTEIVALRSWSRSIWLAVRTCDCTVHPMGSARRAANRVRVGRIASVKRWTVPDDLSATMNE